MVSSESHLGTHNRVIVGVISEDRTVAAGYNQGYVVSGSVKVTHQSRSISAGSPLPLRKRSSVMHDVFVTFAWRAELGQAFPKRKQMSLSGSR